MNFSEFYDVLTKYPSLDSVFNFYDVFINFGLPALLLIPVAYVYRKTHKGVTYNQIFVHTMFIMATTTSIIMMVIGSNIARAFSLVGALSVIRFRTAIKDGRDTGYIFAAMAIGMSCGTGMYMVAIAFSLCFCIMMLVLTTFRVGEKILTDKVLNFHVTDPEYDNSKLENIFDAHTKGASLVHSDLNDDGSYKYTYIITSPKTQTDQELLQALRNTDGIKNVSVFYNDQRIEI